MTTPLQSLVLRLEVLQAETVALCDTETDDERRSVLEFIQRQLHKMADMLDLELTVST